jgi:chromosome partitioning protein
MKFLNMIIKHKRKDELASKKRLGRIIAFTNQKGGVGKSTTAVNVSAYLSSYGYRTLLIDLDPQSNSTSGLGINPMDVKESIYDILIHDREPNEIIMDTSYKNLRLLPSSIQLAGAEVELVSSLKREFRLREAVSKIEKDYDFILIDCPPALGLLTINALTAAKEVIIPIQCEYYALEGLGQLLNTIDLVRKNLNDTLKIKGAIMTMYDPRIKLAEQVIEEVKNHFSEKVYKTVIPRNVRLSEAPSYGKPIIEYDPDCKGAEAYSNFTKEVIENG